METYNDIYKTICRLCLLRGDSDNMVSLIDNNSKNGLSSYGAAVKIFAQISIEKNDSFPKTMCAKCLILLKQAISFKLTCESSEKQLKNIKNNISSHKDIFKEKVVDFIMYRQLFPQEMSAKSFKYTKKRKKEQSKEPEMEYVSDQLDTCILDDGLNQSLPSSEDEQDKILNDIERTIEHSASLINTHFKEESQNSFKYKKVKTGHKKYVVKPQTQKKIKKNVKSFVCHVCNKVLANSQTYFCHMQRHNGFRYICEHCGKGCTIRQELEYHQVVRHGIGGHLQCQQCPFKAARRIDLVEHERLHTGERPFACEKCGLTFRRRAIWRKHLVHHSEKKIQCKLCPKKFYKRGDMLVHCNNVHDRMYLYSCAKCGATYAKSTTVRRHMAEKHGIPREMQGKITRINMGRQAPEQ